MKKTAIWTMGAMLVTAPIHAQTIIPPRDIVGAAIASEIVQDRQAARDARRQPYASPGYGPINSAAAARDACVSEARQQAGPGAQLIGKATVGSMASGWEVEGTVGADGERSGTPFVCSVRNGSVSGVLLRR